MRSQRSYRFAPECLEGLPPLVQQIYARRLNGVHERDKHLNQLLPPDLLDLNQAVERIAKALWAREPLLIYGDYDVDGVCATALMVRVLKRLGADVRWFIPDRVRHGYGLTVAGIAAARTYHPEVRLWITVDNGMKSHSLAKALAEQGIELLITDHHLPDANQPNVLPQAVAVVNPNRVDCSFASKALCGAGVAFYVLLGLQQYLKQQSGDKALWSADLKLSAYLDLVALATIADVVPLDYNNRILVEHGLKLLRAGLGNLGIRALLAQANITPVFVSAQDLGFMVAPRLNAAGRMAHMKEGVQLLLCDEWMGAQDMARQLDDYNRQRKALENDALSQAKQAMNPQQSLAFFYWQDGHEGLLGLLAGRLKALCAQPSLVACPAFETGWVKASMRSCYGVALDALLAEASEIIDEDLWQFGGHAQAAGLTIHQSALPVLVQALERMLRRDFPTGYPPEPRDDDGTLSPDYLTVAWARYFEWLEPWGTAFPAPVFRNVFEVVDERILGQHARLVLRNPEDGQLHQAMWFFAEKRFAVGQFVCLRYGLTVNRFHGDERLVLQIHSVENEGEN